MRRYIYIICFGSLLILSHVTCNAQSKKIENNFSIAKQYIEAWNNYDSSRVTSFFSDDFKYEDIAFNFKISSDKDKLKSFVHGTIKGVPDLHFYINSISANDSIVSLEWIWKGTFTGGFSNTPATNQPISIRGVSIIEIQNNLIKRNTDYYNSSGFRKK